MKNKELLLDVLGEAGEQFVPELSGQKKKRSILKWVLLGGVCAAAIACAVILPGRSAEPAIQAAPDSGSSDGQDQTALTDENSESAAAEGVYIPAVELPDPAAAATMDLIGLVVYQGRIYTQAKYYTGDEVQKIMPLVGAHLGTAKGNIDEWSAQDEYDAEFASNIAGEVYAVNGYDSGFRICIYGEAEDENSNHIVWVEFLECLNGITLRNGAELFEDRLHLREQTGLIQFQTHSDWDYGTGQLQTAEIEPEIWNTFWDQVDQSAVVNTWDPELRGGDTIYDTPNQAHIILSMNDGTVVRVRLVEGGYVGYDALGWYFVKIPEDIFNPVYDACGGTH